MKRIKMIISAIISAAIVLSAAPCVFAENVLTGSSPLGSYSIEAERIVYIGDKASFIVDIPYISLDSIELSDSELIYKEDGSAECELFYVESENGYISCTFHQSDQGFEGEADSWSGMDDTVLYKGVSSDGLPYCIAEMNLYGFSAFIGEFPIDDNSWVNITLSFPESEMDAVRDDVTAMMSTFTRIESNDSASVGKNEVNPDTGNAECPITVPMLLIIISAANVAVNAVKRHENKSN